MDHPFGARGADQFGHGLGVGDISAHHAEARIRRQPPRPQLFQRDVVIGVEVVHADDGLAALQQALRHVHADEAGRSGDNDGHEAQPRPMLV